MSTEKYYPATWVASALEDMKSIALFISNWSPEKADEMLSEIEQRVASLSTFPLRYKPGRVSGTREMVVGKYIVVYQVIEDEVIVLRVLHAAQNRT